MNYTTSKDYEELWRLVQEGKEIVCFTHGLSTYVSIAMKQGKYVAVFSRGVGGVGDIETNSEIDFMQTCKKLNLEFLPPDEWIKIENDRDLPKINKSVLSYDGQSMCEAKWDGVDWENCMSFCCEKEHITHWMPLPEAPKE
jgi:hypothetical protein